MIRFRIFALTALAYSGCAVMSTGGYPRAEDCALVRQATPSEFYCGGYGTCTAVQLTDIREGKATSCKAAAIAPSQPIRDVARTYQLEPTVG